VALTMGKKEEGGGRRVQKKGGIEPPEEEKKRRENRRAEDALFLSQEGLRPAQKNKKRKRRKGERGQEEGRWAITFLLRFQMASPQEKREKNNEE